MARDLLDIDHLELPCSALQFAAVAVIEVPRYLLTDWAKLFWGFSDQLQQQVGVCRHFEKDSAVEG